MVANVINNPRPPGRINKRKVKMYEKPETLQCETVVKVEKLGMTLKIYFADGSILFARYRDAYSATLICK